MHCKFHIEFPFPFHQLTYYSLHIYHLFTFLLVDPLGSCLDILF